MFYQDEVIKTSEYIMLGLFLLTLQFLQGMVLSGSLSLLEVLVSIMCRESRHAHEDRIQSTLQEFLNKSVYNSHSVRTLSQIVP